MNKWLVGSLVLALVIGAGYLVYSHSSILGVTGSASQPQTSPVAAQVATSSATPTAAGATTVTPNSPTAPASDSLPTGSSWLPVLPLGDYKYTTSGPKKGYIYVCHVASGGEGAQGNPTWISGTQWYPAKKVSVQGAVSWPTASVSIAVTDGIRKIIGNGLPVGYTTGIYPIKSSDPAYQIDRNPNTITAQTISYNLPANPTPAATPSCIYGQVGIMTDGVPLFDGFDAEYRDAAAHEVQDSCDAHPEKTGQYHYHNLSSCFKDISETTVLGWAFDGYPITGPQLSNGNFLTTNDLDECHGITSPINENGKTVTTYHYVMTQDFPYSVSCFRGKSYEPKPGQQGQSQGSKQGAQNSSMPQSAIDACSGKSQGNSCSFSTPNGTITGTCATPPNQSSMACIPGA